MPIRIVSHLIAHQQWTIEMVKVTLEYGKDRRSGG
jgi:hypothetical protein